MRFIIGFIFFGLLFYSIWFYFPEVFQTLVSWVAKIFDLIHQLVQAIVEKISSATPHETPPKSP